MFTRQDYMDKKCSHREYYAQFVTTETRLAVAKGIGVERIAASQDEHLNDIPLNLWGNLPHFHDRGKLKEAGDFFSLGGWVCIAKEAARQLCEERST